MNIITLITSKLLVGIEIRTNNTNEFSSNGKIPKLWERFFSEEINKNAKDKTSENIYAVYSNYESDHTGEYNYFIGFEVKDVKSYLNNDKFIIKEIKQGKYSVVITDKGSLQKVILAAWKKIWKMSSSDLGGKRLYKTDYEIYTQNATDPNGEIFNIYLGINA